MKNIIYIGILALACFAVYSFMNPRADFKTDKKEGIQFFRGSWTEALKLAKKEKKLIFLDIYATWCGPCKMLKSRTFSNSRVAKYFNNTFINVSLDGEADDGITVAEKYSISGYPSLLFIDAQGTVLLQGEGFHDADELIKLGKEAMK